MTAAHHDLGYRALFAHPEMVRDLITGFTPFKLLDGVALSAFERVNSDYVSGRPSARQGDVVWRVQVGDQFLDVYILLECQSGVDRCMALRMQTYVGLLCQDLVKRHKLSPTLLLPPVLPLVFYNGLPAWNAPLELAGLLMAPPAELAALQPSQRYVLIDQQRLDRTALDTNPDLLALLFRIELSQVPDVLSTHMPALKTWFSNTPLTSLRTSVWAWWKALLGRRIGSHAWVDLDNVEEADMESAMLSWAEQLEQIGLQKGLALAEKAKEEAWVEGKAEGKAEGISVGHANAMRTTLGSLLNHRFGNVPAWAAHRIAQGTREELEQWFERGFDATTLAAVFGEDRASD